VYVWSEWLIKFSFKILSNLFLFNLQLAFDSDGRYQNVTSTVNLPTMFSLLHILLLDH
jgi:hypothetical protein